MKRIPTTDLKPGMFTARPVRTAAGQIILDEGCLLSAQTILHIHDYSIPEVWIRDSSDSSGGLHDYLQKQYAPVRSRSERIRQSEEYKIFSQKFDSCTTMLHTALNDCILRAKKLETDKLLAGTLDLFASHTTTLSMFDMLHNLRQIDDSTYAHSVNVAIISRMLGNWLGFSEDAQNTLSLCGLLHDIGKSRIPASIIGKPGRLTSEEFEQIKRHPLLGYELLKNQPLDPHIKNAALMHHERCDGSGYPFGLYASDIDDYASIIAVADVYDAMTADRCYRLGLCPFEVIAQFEQEGLQRYKPRYILTFLEHIAHTYLHNRVLLNNGQTGEIIFINKRLTRPTIQIAPSRFINLEEHPELYIQAII